VAIDARHPTSAPPFSPAHWYCHTVVSLEQGGIEPTKARLIAKALEELSSKEADEVSKWLDEW
jgi:hypothetical protein